MQELVVASGKGGTGKTSVVASFAALADSVVVADCDVDAADLHLVLTPRVLRREGFSGGSKARIDPGRCVGCGQCKVACQFDAVLTNGATAGMDGETYCIDSRKTPGTCVCPTKQYCSTSLKLASSFVCLFSRLGSWMSTGFRYSLVGSRGEPWA